VGTWAFKKIKKQKNLGPTVIIAAQCAIVDRFPDLGWGSSSLDRHFGMCDLLRWGYYLSKFLRVTSGVCFLLFNCCQKVTDSSCFPFGSVSRMCRSIFCGLFSSNFNFA